MRRLTSTKYSLLLLTAGLGVFGWLGPAVGQTFIEPSAPAPGGRSASWITTTDKTEWKVGSLQVGTVTIRSKICLNATDQDDPNRCIDDWSDVVDKLGGPFVPLRKSGLAPAAEQYQREYFTTPTATPTGAVAIQASGTDQAISLLADANTGLSITAGAALFASDGGQDTNLAAQFDGRVSIGPTELYGILTPGQLCLNSPTAVPYVSGAATGCITTWSEITSTITNYVRLQPTNPPTADAGSARVTGVGNFGAVILGHPPAGQPNQTFCGDGYCATHLNENVSGNGNYCPVDCTAPNPPTNLTVAVPGSTSLLLSITGQTQQPTGNYYLLLVRSSSPTFTFVPQNGVSYTPGMSVNGARIVASIIATGSTTYSRIDVGLTRGTTYYYRLYQANLFPIYNQTPLARTFTTTP